MTKVVLDEAAGEIVGLYTGTLAGLIALLHRDGLIDGRALVAVEKEYATPLGQFFADNLASTTNAAIDRAEGRAPRLTVIE